MASPIVTDTRYNQEIQRSDRSVTQDARSITETTSNSTTVRSGGSRTIVVPTSSTTLASPEEIAHRYTVVYSGDATQFIENSRILTPEQRFGGSAILAAEAQAKSRDEELSKVTVPTFDSTGAIAAPLTPTSTAKSTNEESQKPPTGVTPPSSASAPLTPTSTAKSTNEEIDNRAAAFTLSPETMRDINAASKAESAKTELDKGINTNTELTEEDGTGGRRLKARTVDSAFSTGERTKGTFNIGRFRAEVSGADSVLPTHSFLVVFAPMLWTRSKFSAQNLDSLLTMRCDNVVLPSVNLLQEQNIRRYGFGPVENVAYGVNVGDFTLQFIVDKEALVVEYFEEWLNRIVNRDSFGGANMNNDTNGRKPYEIAYKDTYSCPNVNVFVYDRSQNQVMTYNIYDVFPTGIQSMNMSWSEENTLMKLNITFSFTDLRINRIPPKTNKDDKSFKDEIIVTGRRRNADGTFVAGGAGSALTTLNSPLGRALELTDLTNETTIIGDFAGRIRGSVPSIIDPTFGGSTPLPEIPAQTLRILTG